MLLTVSINGAGYHVAAWRLSERAAGLNAAGVRQATAMAEAGGVAAALFGISRLDHTVRSSGRVAIVEPDALSLVAALIGHTSTIGLGAAYALERSEPYNIARGLATLDRLSLGRTAWIIDLARDRGHGGRDGAEHDYERAGECIEVARKLWDSWEDEAFVVDKTKGWVADSSKVHRIDHAGPHFTVRGPLNGPRPTQGHPVLVMTDPGDFAGRKLAAGIADLLLVNCDDGDAARGIRQTIRSYAQAASREPDALKVMMTVSPILGSTETEARRLEARLSEAVEPVLALALLQSQLGPCAADASVSVADAGRPLSELWSSDAIVAAGLSPTSTILAAGRDFAGRVSGLKFVGTPERLAEWLADLHAAQACDGFNIAPAVLPGGLQLLVDRTLPRLRKAGVLPAQASGRTLRERMGLEHPLSRYRGQP